MTTFSTYYYGKKTYKQKPMRIGITMSESMI